MEGHTCICTIANSVVEVAAPRIRMAVMERSARTAEITVATASAAESHVNVRSNHY